MYHRGILLEQMTGFNTDCIPVGEKKQIPEDRISRLPDDILVLLLCHLSLKEAGTTSILSKRWEHVWEFTKWLKFDVSNILHEIPTKFCYDHNIKDRVGKNTELLWMERDKYVSWLDKVLKSYKGSRLEEFSVWFDLNSMYSHKIDNWLQFAFSRRLKNLEVNLYTFHGIRRNYETCCTFPNHILLDHSRAPAVFKYLEVLILKSVSVSNEVLQFFLSNCPCLESVVVHGSNSLEDFEVSGSSLALKHLEIIYCPKMMTLKVCNTNIISLEVLGDVIVHVEILPSLVEVSLGDIISFGDTLKSLSSCLSQLEVLKLHMSRVVEEETYEYPSLPKLKQLVIYHDVCDRKKVSKCFSLIKAAPYLEEFVMQLMWILPSRVGELGKLPRCPLHYLRRVKFAGYYGRNDDLELTRFFLKNVATLRELVIDTRNQFALQRPYRSPNNHLIEEGKTTRALAKQHLEGKVPLQVGLSII